MAYRLLSLTAISGEFPTDQLNRLPGSPYYLESVVTALKKDGLLRTYYRDKLRGYRLGPRAKATLLESRPDRFASYLTGDTDTNRLKCEIDRRLRLFGYFCDLPRIARFNTSLELSERPGTLICFDFQAEVLRSYCGSRVRFQTIDFTKFEGRLFP